MPGKIKIFEDYKKKRKDRLDKAEASKGLKATVKNLEKPNREIDSPTTFRADSPIIKMAKDENNPVFNFPTEAAWNAKQQELPINRRFDGTYKDAKTAYIRDWAENKSKDNEGDTNEFTFTRA